MLAPYLPLYRRVLRVVMLISVCVLCPAMVMAQAKKTQARPIGLDNLPRAIESTQVTPDGDLLLIAKPRYGKNPTPMVRIMAASTMFQTDPITFSKDSWSNLRIEHAAQSVDGKLWAIGRRDVIYRSLQDGWKKVAIGEVNRNACAKRKRYRGPCQMVLPISGSRAVALRPVYGRDDKQQTILSTQVIALQQGYDKPLATVLLPNVVLGPAVQDGQGGFWVMMQRVNIGSNYKPLRGYLHYTSKGEWLMWSDSGESVAGTTLKGRSGFVIDPEQRKMAPDGKGGFYAIGKDRKVYHVDANGKTRLFSANVPTCQYCRPLSLYSESKQLHLLMAKWKDKEAGAREMIEELKWLQFDVNGAPMGQSLVPVYKKPTRWTMRTFYNNVRIQASAGNVWLTGPGLIMHRDSKGWSWIGDQKAVEAALIKQYSEQEKQTPSESSPTLQLVGVGAGAALAVGGLIGNYMLADDDRTQYIFTQWALSTLVGYYPGSWLYPYVIDNGDPAQLRWTCLGTTVVAMPLAVGLTTWLVGESTLPTTRNDSFSGKRFLSATGGAALGTLTSMIIARIIYGAEPQTAEWVVNLIGASIVSSAAGVGYFLSD